MRIGILLSSFLPPRDEIGNYAWNLACFLRNRGHIVHLFAPGGWRSASEQIVDDLVIHHSPGFPLNFYFHGLFVSHLLRREQSALDLLHLHFPFVFPPKTSLPMLATVHSTSVGYAYQAEMFSLPTRLERALEQTLFRRVTRITAVSAGVAGQLRTCQLPQVDIPVIGNGVFTDFFVPAPPRVFMPEKPIFLSVVRLATGKGLEDFIIACQKVHFVYPNTRFMLIGSGPFEAELRSEITRCGLDGVVRLVGEVTDRLTLSIFYQNAYAYVQPSPCQTVPVSLLEAMSTGKAVIAAAAWEAGEIIRDGENGLLVPPRRPDELARAMLRLLEYPDLASNLGQAARQTVERQSSWEIIGERYLQEYRALLRQAT